MNPMELPEFASLAQAFVEATSSVVSGRTINIMDVDGTIIASTEKQRIGTCHYGAREVALTGKPLRIDETNVDQYPGAKTGYNLPIFDGDKVIGVVGMFGTEDEIKDAANLLRVYVTQYFKQQVLFQEKNREQELRQRLLTLYITGAGERLVEQKQLAQALGFHLTAPFVLLGLRCISSRGEPVRRRLLEQLRDILESSEQLVRTTLWGMEDRHLVIIHSLAPGKKTLEEGLIARLCQLTREKETLGLAISHRCEDAQEIPEAAKEIMLLLELPDSPIHMMENGTDRTRYFLRRLLPHGGATNVKRLLARLEQAVNPEHLSGLLETARVYYEENSSVERAARRLSIHKNTLQYRLKRLYEALGVEEEAPFSREFLIRLLLEYREQDHTIRKNTL